MITRTILESAAVAVNKHLKDVVKDMDIITLLRNCHPIDRKDYARALHRDGQLTEKEMLEVIA
jgi:hypothetical protein